MIHFTWDISIGQILTGVPLFGIGVALLKIYNMMLMFRMEHEILMQDWSKRTGIELHTIPTRQKKFW